MGYMVSKYAFFPPPPVPIRKEYRIVLLTTKEKYIVPAIHIRNQKNPGRYTILFSHGNAEDLGCIEDWMEAISFMCNADVFAYEYPGYGFSRNTVEGSPITIGESAVYSAANAAYDHLISSCNPPVPPNRIILFGRSLGTGPTVELASKKEHRAVILQSPLMSAVRVVMNTPFSLWFDIFTNIDKIRKVKTPVLIMHGERDEVVPVTHGKSLYSKLRNPYPALWIPQAGHNDMEARFYNEMDEKLKAFMTHLETTEPSSNNPETSE